jgi:class 3 adenylate cyclase
MEPAFFVTSLQSCDGQRWVKLACHSASKNIMPREYHYTFIHDLQATPEVLWPFVSDTNRFNRDTGLPPMQLLGIQNKVKRVRFKVPLVNVQWEEEPFEWTYPYRFGILRRYLNGPLIEMRVDCRLERLSPSGTKLTYDVHAVSRNLIGDIIVPFGIGVVSKNAFEKIFHKYDRVAARGGSILDISLTRRLSSAEHAKFKILSERLRAQGVDENILDRLYEFIHRADELSIQRMRPYALADSWKLPRRAVLEACLRATRAGMLDMYWDILCPECRGVTADNSHLSDLSSKAHCNTCQIDFTASFDHNVEVVFRTNASVRPVDAALEFCVGSPQRQPHIALSLMVPAREELPVTTMLEKGRYTMRTAALQGSQILLAGNEGAGDVEIRARNGGWPYDVTRLTLMPRMNLVNETDQTQTFELIRTAWSDQAATAADVTTLQTFRDLFSTEVLRLGEEISVSSVTLMFTDLRNSTKLYRDIGDAPAFGRVREHFQILQNAVDMESGAIVKTMGDAVMAAFRTPAAAVKAIWNVQQQLTARGEPLLLIKVGIHHGPCIVVNLNERLDYFGSTVNIAARLPNFSMGGEVIISEPIRNDSEVLEFLEKNAQPNSLIRFQSEIKGYDQSMDLWRIKM